MSFLQKKKNPLNLLAVLAIAGFGLHLLVLLMLAIQGISIRQLSVRKPPNFVQLVNGKRIVIEDNLNRDPENIKEFVRKTMTLMFNWTGVLPPQNLIEVTAPRIDKGISIPGNQKVTTNSWLASFGLSEDFRKGFLREIATLTPLEVFSSTPEQKISVQLMITRVNPPQLISRGKWRVGIVGNLLQTKQVDGRKVVIPFNKDLLVRAVDYFPYAATSDLTDLQKAIYSMRREKLEIYEIRNLSLLDN